MKTFETFLAPKSIAVIGASEAAGKIGSRIMRTLIDNGYPGAIFPVNPAGGTIHGRAAFAAVSDLPEAPDLALVCIPAALVPEAIEAAAERGVRNFVVVSSGFAESGAEGAALQERVLEIGRRRGLLISGPNSEGFYNVPARIAATFSPAVNVPPGPLDDRPRIGVVAQSGGLGFALYNRGRRDGLSFSTIISVGNQADLEVSAYAEALLDDPATSVILLFIEGLKNPERFKAFARRAARLGKPVIVAKVGGSEAGRRAVESHTGSLSGAESAYDAIFARYGVIRVHSQEDMLDVAAMLTRFPAVRGNRVAIVTSSGGTAAWLTDTCEAHGLTLPVIDAARQRQLMEFIPSYGSAANPVDLTGQGMNGISRSLEILADSPDLDAIIVAGSFAHEGRLKLEGEAIRDIARRSATPILLFSYTVASDASRALLDGLDLHCFATMGGAAMALRAGVARTRFLAEGRLEALDALAARGRAQAPVAARAEPVLCEFEAAALLAPYGVPTAEGALVRTGDEAVAAAERLGWPVAAKIQSPRIPHKTEAGGVALGLATPEALRAAVARILAAAARHAPAEAIRGVLIQKMQAPGLELIAGVKSDRDFGPIVMCGLGGVFVEVFRDVAFAPAPLTRADAAEMLSSLRAAPLIDGVRGRPPLDRAAMEELLVALSRFADDNRDRIDEIDLNPVFLRESGLSVADTLILMKDPADE